MHVADLDFLDDEEVDQAEYSALDIKLAEDFDVMTGQDDLALIKVSNKPNNFKPILI